MSTATLGRVNLGGIGRKAEKTKTEYPAITTARAIELAGLILKLDDEMTAVKANLDINKADLRSLVVPEYFKRHAGLAEVPSSMAIRAADGREVLVSMTSRYKQPTDMPRLISLLGGDDAAARYLKPSFKLEIDSDQIPVEKQQAVVDELVAVLTKFGCGGAIKAKEELSPVEDFHAGRHARFTPEVNMQIEDVMPMTVAVKTKGRGK